MDQEIRELKKLYVGNLDYDLKIEEFKELFTGYGEVKDCFLVQGKGFGFCEFEDQESAEKAKEALDESLFQERTLKVNFAIPKSEKKKSFLR